MPTSFLLTKAMIYGKIYRNKYEDRPEPRIGKSTFKL